MVISYETNSFRRRFILEDDKIIESRSFRKTREKGEVYFGRVLERIDKLGYTLDLGDFKGLCQEELSPGEEGLFELIKYQEDKYPLFSSRVGFIGQSLILRQGKTSYSPRLPQAYRELLEGLGLEGVYFRRSAASLPLRKVKEEYGELVKLRDRNYIKPGLIFAPSFIEEGDSFYFRELESRIVELAGGYLKRDGLSIYFEMTRAGLVVDVNGLGSPQDINERAWPLIEESLILMNVGGLVMVDLVGQGQGYSGPGSLTKEGILVRSYPQRGVNLFAVDRRILKEEYLDLTNRLREML